MKKSTVILAVVFCGVFASSFIIIGCGSKPTGQQDQTEEATKSDSTQMTYMCPMHPEIKGKAGDVCSKCGMKLEAMKSADSTATPHDPK